MAGTLDERDELALKLRQVLVEARKAAGLTQGDLAKKLGRTQTFVSNYERGERKVGVVELILIARGLCTEAPELLARIA
jgi:transcriptional regulator with XRE-family HTH domain